MRVQIFLFLLSVGDVLQHYIQPGDEMNQPVSNRGCKLPVLPDKWMYLERQRELQVNTTKFAKISAIKKTAENKNMVL